MFDVARIEETTEKLRRLSVMGNTVAQSYYNLLVSAQSDAERLRIIDQVDRFVVSFRPPWSPGPDEIK